MDAHSGITCESRHNEVRYGTRPSGEGSVHTPIIYARLCARREKINESSNA